MGSGTAPARLAGVQGMTVGLAEVTGDAPAAVLLVDLAERAVVYANPLAEQLAPRSILPVGVEKWSEAAALRDLDGAELTETSHPLTKIARSEPVAGQAVSAARASTSRRGRPSTRAPAPGAAWSVPTAPSPPASPEARRDDGDGRPADGPG